MTKFAKYLISNQLFHFLSLSYLNAQNTQNGNQEKSQSSQMMTGAVPRAPTRLPEDVTALAEREMGARDRDSKNAVQKTYHTLKDLISSKFKKDSLEMTPEELNNVAIQQHAQNYEDAANVPYYNLMQQHIQMQQHQAQQVPWNATNGSHSTHQTQMWNGSRQVMRDSPAPITQQVDVGGQQVYPHMVATRASIHQHRAASQPQLNLPFKEHQPDDRRGSLANIDVTDSDEGGFASKQMWRQQPNQQRTSNAETPAQQILHQQQQNYLKRSTMAQSQQILSNGHYQQQQQANAFHLHPQQAHQQNPILDGVYTSQKVDLNGRELQQQEWNGLQRVNQEAARSSFNQEQPQLSQKGEKQVPPIPPAKPPQHQQKKAPNYEHPPKLESKKPLESSTPINSRQSPEQSGSKQVPGSAASSDYDKSGNQSSNVDSGRGSAAYSSGRKALDTSPDHSDTPVPQQRPKSNESEWIDIVDAELRHILEPGMQNLNLRPESTISGSLSSISPPLPPLSPDGSVQNTNDTNKHTTSSNTVTNKPSSSKQSAPQVSCIKIHVHDACGDFNLTITFCSLRRNQNTEQTATTDPERTNLLDRREAYPALFCRNAASR